MFESLPGKLVHESKHPHTFKAPVRCFYSANAVDTPGCTIVPSHCQDVLYLSRWMEAAISEFLQILSQPYTMYLAGKFVRSTSERTGALGSHTSAVSNRSALHNCNTALKLFNAKQHFETAPMVLSNVGGRSSG